MDAEKRSNENTKHITGEILIAKPNPARISNTQLG